MTDAERAPTLLAPASSLVADLPAHTLGTVEAQRFRQGQALPVQGRPDGDCAVFADGLFLGIATVAAGVARPRRVVVERVPVEAGTG